MFRFSLFMAFLTPVLSFAHNCNQFFNSDDRADEAYACEVVPADLQAQKLYRMEVCFASVPYQQSQRYAHGQYMYIELDQYNNPYSKAEGLNTKYVNSFYAGLAYSAYEGSDDNRAFYDYGDIIELRTLTEGSSFLKESDSQRSITINKTTGAGRFVVYHRKSAVIFKGFWNKTWDVQLQCARIR